MPNKLVDIMSFPHGCMAVLELGTGCAERLVRRMNAACVYVCVGRTCTGMCPSLRRRCYVLRATRHIQGAFAGMAITSSIPGLGALFLPAAPGLTALALVCAAAIFAVLGTTAMVNRNVIFAATSPNLQYYWLGASVGLFCINIIAGMTSVLAIDGVRDAFGNEDEDDEGGGKEQTPLIVNEAAGDGEMQDAVQFTAATVAGTASAVDIATEKAAAYQREEEHAKSARDRGYGTRRLLQLAQPHKIWLYAGCIVLFIRLPFSLSMPHWVSEVIGALIEKNYEKAYWNVVYLSIMGTIDSIMDFWCVYLFGLAQQRIIRGLRLDLFKAILWQDIGFYDTNETGEVTSRLTADCAEMANDLTWVFRFSIEAIVRIAGIAGPDLPCCAVVCRVFYYRGMDLLPLMRFYQHNPINRKETFPSCIHILILPFF